VKHTHLIHFFLKNLSKISLRLAVVLLFLFVGNQGFSQINQASAAQQASSIIKSNGLDEAEVRAALQAKGIDIDNVTPEQLLTLQPTIEAVIAELKAKKTVPASESVKQTPVESVETVQFPNAQIIGEKIVAGASIEEKAAEILSEKNQFNLAPSGIYGHHLFRVKDLAIYRTTSEVKPPDSYIMSPGDEITISIFGPSQFDSKFIINQTGTISPTGLPKMFLKGLTLGQTKELLLSRFSNFYRFTPEQFAVTLTTARTIVVNIFGETSNAGSFTVSAVNTAFNALVAAGGPTELGTVRKIKIIRGKETKVLDLYAFINNPSIQYDFFLEDNDIIYVPVAERIVLINGAVNRPLNYELIEKENLKQLIEFAGGFKADAFREILQIRRFINDKQVLIDVDWKNLKANNQDFELFNGDEIFIKSIPSPVENSANIKGKVNLPGDYSLTETPRVSDLVKKGGLKKESRTDLAFLIRENPNGTKQLVQLNLEEILLNIGSKTDLVLKPNDVLTIYEKARFTDNYTISVNGAVRNSLKKYPFSPDSMITLERAINLAGGLTAQATGQGYIMRTNPKNTKVKSYLPINIADAVKNTKSPANIVLEPLDEVLSLSVLSYTDVSQVAIVGAVRSPGKFQYSPTLTVKDLLILAGGTKLEAARNRIDIYRVEITQNEPTRTLALSLEVDEKYNIINSGGADIALYPFDEVVVRTAPEFEFQEFVQINGQVRYAGSYALTSDNERLSSLVKRAGGLSEEAEPNDATFFRSEYNKGFVLTDLTAALKSNNSIEDHILKPGDVISIPKRQSLVSILVANTRSTDVISPRAISNGKINVAYHPRKRAGWYIKNYAGGFTRDARRQRVTVEQPNGLIRRTHDFGIFWIYPKVKNGSIVAVTAKMGKEKKQPSAKRERKEIDWDKKLTQILAATTAFASLVLSYVAVSKL
jgi:protein involved in polysaccharide export with SLBB domain